MNLKLAAMKLAVRSKRKKEVWKNPVGERFLVPRSGKKGIDVLLYRPQHTAKPWPVLFNIHGGAWVGCDASQMDSYCLDMAEKCGAFIVNINYTKLDIQPFPYPQEEIRDAVLYFRAHAAEYGLDPARFAVIGYSAGGHLAAASTLMLHDIGVDLSAQVLCYPFLDFSQLSALLDAGDSQAVAELFFPKGVSRENPYISPAAASDRQLKGLAPTVFVCCGSDPL
ncbi:MAG: alpha/beta hydrolase, partial [Oscillospiraceae bacterium]|nr:alpha/beta hydrolase [Oscillospiraceae bacterium]